MKLEAKLRQKGGVNQLRREGFVPGVIYGRGAENANVTVTRASLEQALKVAGENTLLELEIEGAKSKHVLIHDVQRDPVKDILGHVDFLEVRLDQKIKAEIPLVFVGESPAVKEFSGVLVRNIQHIEVEALPQNLPHEISVDISSLGNFGDQILVKDINLGHDVKIEADAEAILATVQEPKSQEELEAELATPSAGVEDVKIIEKEKKEEEPLAEGEEAPATPPAKEKTA